MEHKVDTKKAKLSLRSWLLLVVSVVILPACLLLPFMDHSSQLEPALLGSKTACTTNAAVFLHNQCSTWERPQTIWPIAVGLLIVLALFGLGLNAYASRLEHRDGRRFANYRFVIAIFVSILGFMAFSMVRTASQNYDAPNFQMVPYTIAQDTGDTGGPYALVNAARFGYGLTPMLVLMLIAGFALPAFVSWHQFMYSRNYVDGQKKEELFQ